MAYMRPGGLSDDEDSEDDLLVYDETFSRQCLDCNEPATGNQV